MICKCKNCGASVTYNPGSGMVECAYCRSVFNPNEVNSNELADTVNDDIISSVPQRNQPKFQGNQQKSQGSRILGDIGSREKIACNIYRCTACGAQLAINRVESSSYCAYCGQPTIVFSRVSEIYRPDFMIPFSVSQKQAESIMRTRLGKGFFVPNEIKNFSVDKVRGIYIPYWMYNMHCSDVLHLQVSKTKGSYSCLKDAMCDFKDLIVDASVQLNDEISQRLEPYDLKQLRPFNTAYMTGFYSDCYDLNDRELSKTAVLRAKELLGDEVKKDISKGMSVLGVSIKDSHAICQFYNPRYILLPAWFLSFHYNGETYTMLVNGQTGKLVGTIPKSKGKAFGVFIGIFACVSAIMIPISMLVNFLFGSLLLSGDGNILKAFLYIIAGVIAIAIICISTAVTGYKQYKDNLALTKEKNTYRFAKNRQDK